MFQLFTSFHSLMRAISRHASDPEEGTTYLDNFARFIMTRTKNFVILARAWTSSPSKKTFSAPGQTLAKALDDPSDQSSSSSDGTETPTSTRSTNTNSTTTSVTPGSSREASSATFPQRRKLDFSILESFFSQATTKDTEPPLWYILAAAVLLALHKEKLIGELWNHVTRDLAGEEEQLLSVARRIREACLKASTLVGFPRASRNQITPTPSPELILSQAINALLSLKSAIDTSHPQLTPTLSTDTSLRSPLPSPEKYARGMAFFQQIYQQHTTRVLSAMDATSGGDLTHFAINCIYGELLSEDRIIGGLETGLLEFVCCLADGCGPQAKGHFFGSINLGASSETLRSAIKLTEELAHQVGLPCPWKADEEQCTEFRFLERVTGQ